MSKELKKTNQPVELDPIERKRRLSLRLSVWEACFYAAMIGFGETYFVPLLVAVGGNSFQAGLFSSIPQLCMSFTQFISILFVENLMVRKRIIFAVSVTQGLFLLFIFIETLTRQLSPWIFIVAGSVYFSVNGIAIPAWNSLMGDYTTAETRGRYFGRRNGLSQLVTFGAVVLAGVILEFFARRHDPITGFAIILAIAVACRFCSSYTLMGHFEFPYKKVEGSYFSFWQFIRRSPKSNFARFVYLQAFMNFSVQISAPFFAVYMLTDLHFTYLQYMIAQGVFIGTHFIAMRRWGVFSDKYGNRLALKITSLMMPVLPVLWLFSTKMPAILLIQVISGLTWGGWILCSSNFLFDSVTPPKRARCVAYQNFFNSMGIFAGALTGAFLSTRAPMELNFVFFRVPLVSRLCYLFALSGFIRLIFVALILPTIKEVRSVDSPKTKEIFMTLSNVSSIVSIFHSPYTAIDTNISALIKKKQNGKKKK